MNQIIVNVLETIQVTAAKMLRAVMVTSSKAINVILKAVVYVSNLGVLGALKDGLETVARFLLKHSLVVVG